MNGKLPVIDDYMARNLHTFSPDENIHTAVTVLLEHRLSGGPVIDDTGKLVGILSKKDCLKVVYTASYHQDWGGRVDEFMHHEVHTMASGTDIVTAADLFVSSGFRRYPVLKGETLVGQISRHDVLWALYEHGHRPLSETTD